MRRSARPPQAASGRIARLSDPETVKWSGHGDGSRSVATVARRSPAVSRRQSRPPVTWYPTGVLIPRTSRWLPDGDVGSGPASTGRAGDDGLAGGSSGSRPGWLGGAGDPDGRDCPATASRWDAAVAKPNESRCSRPARAPSAAAAPVREHRGDSAGRTRMASGPRRPLRREPRSTRRPAPTGGGAAGGPPVPPHGFTTASRTPMTTIEPIIALWPLSGERGGPGTGCRSATWLCRVSPRRGRPPGRPGSWPAPRRRRRARSRRSGGCTRGSRWPAPSGRSARRAGPSCPAR